MPTIKLHEGNVLRAAVGTLFRQDGDIAEAAAGAYECIENLEAQIVRLSQTRTAGQRPAVRHTPELDALEQLVKNLFIILDYPEELQARLRRKLSVPVASPVQVATSQVFNLMNKSERILSERH